ncbi:sushi, von Willebrand factor type A, EGF and pentraxin domain-containing protein 1-like isoform X4 [Oreochromis aureus]|uniref:sushi, von Willebrand factor type A, EGF and pentraxin domain-containing protein 1-like isoform X4 n=1 Tax=Oreochromis aureus TaxID=47969 RepID=UPI00195405CB|nr:sushi, von Willebrand factor type A, EGF and pentraxin domain-containing protein 1-like isoform X4 [Oreochromis aureus]
MKLCYGLFQTRAAWIQFAFICSMLCMWTSVESWSYVYSNESMKWDDARKWCKENYTDMVAIQNREEIEHLNNWLPKKKGYYWIGIRKINDVWTWVGTNKTLTEEATNWAEGEPNNGKAGQSVGVTEDCVEMYIKRDQNPGTWNDERCMKKKTALCYTAACKNDSCLHGECVETINSHKCECFEGFFGDKCGQVVQCNKSEVIVPDKGHVNCSHKHGNFSYDSLCQYSCEEGYKLSVQTPLRCTASGKWSDKHPSCELIQCEKMSEPTHGSMKCSNPLGSFSYQSTCTFTCDEGYVLSASPSLQCESSGNWNASQPFCVAVQCPALQNLKNGFVSCGEDADMRFSYKNTCSFSCDQGYHLVGASSVTCTSGGTWNQQIPHCEAILCQNPEREAPLIMQCSDSVTELRPNSTCSFSCEEGFELQGANTIKCSEDGQWNKNIPTCKVVRCPLLEAPENGHINCSSTESVYNSQCSFTCDQGYLLEGPELLTCDNHGNWTGEKPTCQAILCQNPEREAPLIMQCSDSVTELRPNSTCSFSCEEGFELQGANTIKCSEDGQWNKNIPTCKEKQCPAPEVPIHGQISCSPSLSSFVSHEATHPVGMVCIFTCDEGYVLSGSPSLQCESSGNWNASQPFCVAVQCPALQNLKNGFVSCGEDADMRFSYKNTCSFSCDQGYHLVGASSVTCTSGGTWNQQIPHCEAILCQNPEREAPLIMQCSDSVTELRPNSTCSFNCEEGFELQGANTIKCSEDGQWNKNIPTCKAKGCPAPEVPTNGQISCSPSLSSFVSHETPHPLGMLCNFTCDEGHELQGAHSMECTHPGQWTSRSPICTAVTCLLLEAPENGHINCSSTESVYNSQCSFTCDQGYSLEGHELLTCDHHGNWTREKPTCQAILCQNPEREAPLIMQCSDSVTELRPNSTCSFSCEEGFELQGANTIKCSEDGQWNKNIPTCKVVRCPLLEAPENGHINCSSTESVYNSQCSFTCDQGYSLEGPELLTCDHHGNWTGEKPTCQAILCQNPEREAPLIMQCSDSVTELRPNSTCSFSCEEGFELQGANTIKCSEDGQWNKNIPTCKEKQCPAPEVPMHGQISCSPSLSSFVSHEATHPVGMVCIFTCDEGYVLSGSPSLQCESSGNWNAFQPFCVAKGCPAPEVPTNGQISCSPSLSSFVSHETPHPLGMLCNFTCDEGHELQGAHSMECTHPGQWTSRSPTCTAVTCLFLEAPENGHINCSSTESVYNSQCFFTCDQGYSLEGHELLTCDHHGNWTGEKPTCQAILCQNPEREAPLIMQCSDSVTELRPNSTCSFSCEEGFELQGANTIKCSEDGQWNKNIPTCKAKGCPAPEVPTNGQISCSPSLSSFVSHETPHPLGMLCNFTCDEGHELQGAHSMECTHPGQWTSRSPTCTVVRCPLLEAPENGHINCSSTESVYNSQCSFTCDQGYSLEGPELLTCDHHGNWTGEKPTCQAILCQNPEREAPLFMQCSDSVTELRPNSTCSFSCEEGFELQGANTIKCSEDGQWNKNIPTCKAKGCPAPEVPTNGQISCSPSLSSFVSHETPHPLGMLCNFTCDEGHELQGAHSMECTHPGQWASRSPTCTVVRCLLLEAPENGHINCSSTESVYNSQCSFTCDQGYSLEGPELLTCDHHGNWTGEKPTCQAPAPVTAVTAGVATGGIALLSGVSMAMWVFKKLKKSKNLEQQL